jgi:dihydroxyacid dehydratase/phosphogluconate dehydratase
MYTANTMSTAIEALGMSIPYSSSIPAEDPLKIDECERAGLCALRSHPAIPSPAPAAESLCSEHQQQNFKVFCSCEAFLVD